MGRHTLTSLELYFHEQQTREKPELWIWWDAGCKPLPRLFVNPCVYTRSRRKTNKQNKHSDRRSAAGGSEAAGHV